MSKIFLIGNGFDLAHGRPTRYADFIQSYQDQIFEKVKKEKFYRDESFEISLRREKQGFATIHKCPEKFEDLVIGYAQRDFNKIFFHLIQQFNSESNWVDIEYYYFNKLKTIIRNNDRVIDRVENLNSEFTKIQNHLIDYIKGIPAIKSINPEIHDILKSPGGANNHLYINFNYTDTLDEYRLIMTERIQRNSLFIDIHGSIREIDDNPIIFGYGDEHDDIYKQLESYNNNCFLEFIKYPKYTLTSNIKKIFTYIDSIDSYEVEILGHSCGLSDRTMLKEILDRDKCRSIKIYHYPDRSDFEAKSMELTRHFEEKINLTKKVITFDPNNICPQVK